MTISNDKIWRMVWRADTKEKIAIAEDWLKRNIKDNDFFDDLMTQLSIQSRQICAEEQGRQNWF
jgi:hypothetical protein